MSMHVDKPFVCMYLISWRRDRTKQSLSKNLEKGKSSKSKLFLALYKQHCFKIIFIGNCLKYRHGHYSPLQNVSLRSAELLVYAEKLSFYTLKNNEKELELLTRL